MTAAWTRGSCWLGGAGESGHGVASEWIGAVVTAAALVLALVTWSHQARLTREQRVRDLELVYVQRYWSIRDRMSAGFKAGVSEPVSEEDQRAAIDYLELCEDEADARSQGWISDPTWRFWRASISAAAKDPRLAGTLDRIRSEDRPFQHLAQAALVSEGWDPEERLTPRQRRGRGLRPDGEAPGGGRGWARRKRLGPPDEPPVVNRRS